MPAPPAHCHSHAHYDPVCFTCREYYREQIEELRKEQERPALEVVQTPRERTGNVPGTSPAGPGPVPDQPRRSLLDGMVSGAWLDAQVFPELEWQVEGILPEGFGLLVAPPKAGKSWMVAGIGLACASGGFAFGKIPVKPRPVLYLALEDGHRRLQSRFRTLMEGNRIPADIHLVTQAQPFEVPSMIDEFIGIHTGAKPLVILDTLGKVKPPKSAGQESYSADYAIGSRLKSVIDSEPGASLVAVHHTRKAESVDFVDAVSGTQGIAGSADYVLVLSRKRKETAAVLAVTGRDVPENEYALTMDDGKWLLDGMDLLDAAAAVERRRDSASLGDRSMDVLAHVAANGATTPADIASKFGMDNKVASNLLSRLHESGRIAKPKRGTYDRISTGGESGESGESDE